MHRRFSTRVLVALILFLTVAGLTLSQCVLEPSTAVRTTAGSPVALGGWRTAGQVLHEWNLAQDLAAAAQAAADEAARQQALAASQATASVAQAARPRPKAQRPAASRTGGLTGWDCIRARESGGLVDPHGSNEGTGGYYQFEDPTWHSVGGSGHASSASYEEQTMRAQMLQQRSGWGQWSTAKPCGLA